MHSGSHIACIPSLSLFLSLSLCREVLAVDSSDSGDELPVSVWAVASRMGTTTWPGNETGATTIPERSAGRLRHASRNAILMINFPGLRILT